MSSRLALVAVHVDDKPAHGHRSAALVMDLLPRRSLPTLRDLVAPHQRTYAEAGEDMTPVEEAYAAAWISECWAPVREYAKGERLREWAQSAAVEGYASCVTCGVVFRQPTGLEHPWKWCKDCAREMR